MNGRAAVSQYAPVRKVNWTNFDVVNRILHRSVERGERRRALQGISHVSVDEKAIHRGHKYVCSAEASKTSTRG